MAPGFKTGGRPKGGRNKATAEARAMALATGITPLEYMLGVMRDENAERNRRDDMAKAAAPYLHAKLTNESGMSVNIAGEYTNGKARSAEATGIRVEFVKPRHVDD